MCAFDLFLAALTLQGVAPAALLGIDVSPRMLAHARARFPNAAFAEADFLGPDFFGAADSTTSDGAPQLFDAVVTPPLHYPHNPNPEPQLPPP